LAKSEAADRTIRVLIAEDQLIAEGLRKLLECEFESIMIVGNEHQLLATVATSRPDVVLLDIDISRLNGIEATRRFSKISPATKVVVITAHTDPQYMVEAFGAGASGYVLTCCAVSELVTAIRRVLEGQTYVTPLMADYSVPTAKESAQRRTVQLTARQREVLRLIAKGFTAKEIANALNLSAKTAVFHRMAIMEKLGLHTTAELTRYALNHGILSGASEPPSPATGHEGDQGDCDALAQVAGNN
jgi:DNA-binding NarL/FixJ family response regulator